MYKQFLLEIEDVICKYNLFHVKQTRIQDKSILSYASLNLIIM